MLLPITDGNKLTDYKMYQRGFWVVFQISKGVGACRIVEVMDERQVLESLLPHLERFGLPAEIVEEELGTGSWILETSGSIGRTDRLLDLLRDEHGMKKLRNVIICEAEARRLYGEEACQAALARIRPT
ncbi:hypothetical protein ACLNGM_06395 [Aureimonas phyllosphaerae]|uniref:hypothetical protein n=1 Tax=Aureimonas phyllosphaerae TaxID=1166078 RepID=UPI003A5BF632